MDRLGETSREAEGSWSRRRSIRTVPWGSSFVDRSGLHWAYWAASPIDQYPPWHAHPAAAAAICRLRVCDLQWSKKRAQGWDHEDEEQEDQQGTREQDAAGSAMAISWELGACMVRACLGTQRY